ncbi:hypothetical protein [Bacillus sp. V2I10]|nr:hypothetical protein [Bacillus sp. V2I10]MDQ0858519.1 hypothetical protein [Bacillus sp. V2I10]
MYIKKQEPEIAAKFFEKKMKQPENAITPKVICLSSLTFTNQEM